MGKVLVGVVGTDGQDKALSLGTVQVADRVTVRMV